MPHTDRSRGVSASRRAVCASLLTAACATPFGDQTRAAARPNIVLIVADDLGLSDLGAFGGEIETPNLDALAANGVRFADFTASPTCSPTRAMLLTGADNHTAGVGAMAEAPRPTRGWGYEGVLTPRVATIAERLRAAGYYTTMSGKWHLGLDAEQNPHARGFASSFALLQGGHNHFGRGGFGPPDGPDSMQAAYTQDGERVAIPSEGFYSSDYFTSRLIAQLDAAPRGPFFAYLAFTAPHSPLQAPQEAIAKYRGRYDGGWEVLRERRVARMRALGLIDADAAAPPLTPDPDAWSKLAPAERAAAAREMEVYAASVDRLDQNVGALVSYLRRTRQFDNTVFVFLSDNGAAGETARTFQVVPGVVPYIESADNRLENLGGETSFAFYGPYWAQAATAPYRLFKGAVTEGGTRVPAFMSWAQLPRRGVSHAPAHVMDITPTLLDLAGAPVTQTLDGNDVAPLRGRSIASYLRGLDNGDALSARTIAFELHGQRAVRQGEWKLVFMSGQAGAPAWALYNLASDPAEMHDVGALNPQQRDAMIAAWEAFAAETRI